MYLYIIQGGKPLIMQSKIRSVEAIPVKMPLNKTYKGSNYFMTHRVTVVTQIVTEDGIVGEIYNGDEMDHLEAIVDMIKTDIAPRIIGMNIFDSNGIWEKIYPLTYNIVADRKIALNALACVDSAVHNAIGKTLKAPLVQL
jgi:L-alanine-DL-glutamate epimerase-like enolase superfamily enzyme